MHTHYPPLPYTYTLIAIFKCIFCVPFYIHNNLFVFSFLFHKSNRRLCHGAHRCMHDPAHYLDSFSICIFISLTLAYTMADRKTKPNPWGSGLRRCQACPQKAADIDSLRHSPDDPHYSIGPVHTPLYVQVTWDWWPGHLPRSPRTGEGGDWWSWDQWVLKKRELPGFAIVNKTKRPHPWETHYRFSIKTLLSMKGKKNMD